MVYNYIIFGRGAGTARFKDVSKYQRKISNGKISSFAWAAGFCSHLPAGS